METWLKAVYGITPFLIIGVGICLLLFISGCVVFHQVAGRHKKTEKYTIAEFFPDRPELPKEFNSYRPVHFRYRVRRGYKLPSTLLQARENNSKVVILVHGIYGNRFEHAPQAVEYLKRGFDVFLFNLRGTTGSGAHCDTYGYREKDDLDSMVDLLYEKYGYREIGVHGFSMGAATAAMHSEMNEEKKRVSYYILDSPFSSMYDELLFIAKRGRVDRPKERKMSFHFMLRLGNFMNYVFLHFGYKAVVPKESVRHCTVPMFVIHGKGDETCPAEMGEEIYDSKFQGMRKIWTPEGSRHIASYYDRSEEYFERVTKFIAKAREGEDGREIENAE